MVYRHNMKKLSVLISFLLLLAACQKDEKEKDVPLSPQQYLLQSFNQSSGFGAWLVNDTAIVNHASRWQGQGDYPGVDKWFAVKIVPHHDVYGGLPGQSAFYSIKQTLLNSQYNKVTYWKMLQVKENVQFGYRPKVGEYDIEDTITAAISIVEANPQFGPGGAWQLYIENYDSTLSLQQEINLN